MRTNVTDIFDEEIFVGDTVRVGLKKYVVRYGNYKYFGTERVGVFLEAPFPQNPCDTIPISQARSIYKIVRAK